MLFPGAWPRHLYIFSLWWEDPIQRWGPLSQGWHWCFSTIASTVASRYLCSSQNGWHCYDSWFIALVPLCPSSKQRGQQGLTTLVDSHSSHLRVTSPNKGSHLQSLQFGNLKGLQFFCSLSQQNACTTTNVWACSCLDSMGPAPWMLAQFVLMSIYCVCRAIYLYYAIGFHGKIWACHWRDDVNIWSSCLFMLWISTNLSSFWVGSISWLVSLRSCMICAWRHYVGFALNLTLIQFCMEL